MPVPATRTATDTAPENTSGHPRSGAVLACACACTLLVMGLVAAINLAVPMLAASSLRPSSSQLLWIVDAYVLVFACLVLPGGAAGDRFGRKGVLLSGLITFAFGAAVSATSTTVPLMLAGRVVTGVGAALVLPNCVGVLLHATEPANRRRALAIWAAASGLGGIVGNLGGGAVLTDGSWRTLFVATALLAIGCACWVGLTVPRSTRQPRDLDPTGTTLFVAATLALLLALIEGPEHGWRSPLVAGGFVAGVALVTCWVVAGLRSAHPMLDPRLFRIRLLAAASLGMLVTFFGSFGLFYINASLLQYERGYSVLRTGFAILPLAVPLLIVSQFVPALTRRIGIRATVALAFGCIGLGLLGLSSAVTRPYPIYAAWLVLIGVGFALALPALSAELTAALPLERAGVGGGLQAATRELGSALGVAVVGTIITTTFTHHLPEVVRRARPVPRTVAEAFAAAPSQHAAIVDAFGGAAAVALRVAGAVALVAGAVVVAATGRSR